MADLKPFVLGVDPGKNGAYAALTRDGKLMAVGLCPRLKVGTRWEENWPGMGSLMRSFYPDLRAVYVEQTQAGPLMSKHSTHVLAFNGGLWVGCAAGFGFRVQLVRPKEWQKALFHGLPPYKGKPKEAAVLVAGRLWPELDERLSVKANQGMADAACIAEYGRRHLRLTT